MIYKRLFLPIVCSLLFVAMWGSSCRHKAVIPETQVISYNDQIAPIITSNCASSSGCHDAQSHRALSSHDKVMSYVSAGNAHSSELYKAITSLGADQMPVDKPLNEDQIKLIYVWIMQGAQNN